MKNKTKNISRKKNQVGISKNEELLGRGQGTGDRSRIILINSETDFCVDTTNVLQQTAIINNDRNDWFSFLVPGKKNACFST